MNAIRVDWADENKNILLFTFVSEWTWQEFNAAGSLSMEMMGTVNHPVIQILDMRQAQALPKNVLSNGRKAIDRKPHPNLEKVIVVGINGYFNAIYRAFEKMLPASWIDKWNLAFVDTLVEAVEQAQQDLTQSNPQM